MIGWPVGQIQTRGSVDQRLGESLLPWGVPGVAGRKRAGEGWSMPSSPDESTLLVFMDECGDHTRTMSDADFPLLLLAFVLIEPGAYREAIIPAMGRLKLGFWPHEGVNLHSRDIRKQLGDFARFHRKDLRERLMDDLSRLVRLSPFELVISCVHKTSAPESWSDDPYFMALAEGLRRVSSRACQLGVSQIHLIAEARGKREDREMAAWLEEHLATTYEGPAISLVVRAKHQNIAGLQLADLCAYPAARYVLRPQAASAAFDLVREHLVGWVEIKRGGGI